MSVFDAADFHDHEEVAFFSDKASGLKAIVAVHSTVLGPACGGTRMYPYATAQDAVTDVLRLSRGMSYKNAIADLPLGGGKAVIIGDPLRDKSEAKFAAFAEAINALGGRYITAVDSGTDGGDMAVLARYTPHVVGHTASASLETDPSPWTARGVFLGMRAAARARLGASTLRGLRVAVQGVGHVGRVLAQLAHADGAKLVLADFDAGKAELLARDLAAETVPADRILHVDADILSPCALGGVLTSGQLRRHPCPHDHRCGQQPARHRGCRRDAPRAGHSLRPGLCR